MRAEGEGLKRCEAHGLNYDGKLTRGCVLCRKSGSAADPTEQRKTWALGGLALLALGAFSWLYVKPLIAPSDDARHSYLGLAPRPDAPRPVAEPQPEEEAELEATAGAGAAVDAPQGAPAATEAARVNAPGSRELRPLDEALWAEVAREFELYEGNEPVLQELRGGYAIHVHVPRAGALNVEGKLVGARPTQAAIVSAAAYLIKTLNRYPRRFVQRIAFQRLVLVANLKHKGVAASAFAMGPAGAMIANPAIIDNDRVLDHELFHFADFRLHGFPPAHDAFVALNAPGTRYRGGGRAMIAGHTGPFAKLSEPRRDLPGFVSAYAQAASAEDMAEVFSLLMTRGAIVKEIAVADKVIAAKAEYVAHALDEIEPGTRAALGL